MSDVFLCGGDRVEDVNRSECHLRETPEVQIPTSHTIGRAIKELSHEDMEYKSSSSNVFRFNTNPRLNNLLMKLNMKMSLLSLLSLKSTQGSPCFLSLNQQKQTIDIMLLRALFVVEKMNKYAKRKERMNKHPKQRL